MTNKRPTYYPDFRNPKKVMMITCVEGEGTKKSPRRTVYYVYEDFKDFEDDFRLVGKIDTLNQP